MNKEIISAMLSSDSPAPINGEGRGGKPYFTKADAMYCVSGMPQDAWNYMQFVDIMINEMFMDVSSQCGLEILKRNEYSAKDREKIQVICEIALCEARQGAKPIKDICRDVGTTRATWYRKYKDVYNLANDIYRMWDREAGRYVAVKLGKLDK